MKKLLKWLGIGITGVLTVIALFLASGYLLPAETTLELEQTVDAPPDAMFTLFTTYDGVEKWWRQAALDMGDDLHVTHLGGPQRGEGMELGFGPSGGDVFERWTYTSVESPSRVEVDVDFQIFMSHRVLELEAEGTGTKVRLRETAHVESPLWRWMLKLNTEAAVENRHTVLIAAGTAAQR